MSEKKSLASSNPKSTCTVCREESEDFLEQDDWSDSGFILCANCEAVSATQDLYGEYNYDDEYGSSRESLYNLGLNPRTTEVITFIPKNFQEAEAE